MYIISFGTGNDCNVNNDFILDNDSQPIGLKCRQGIRSKFSNKRPSPIGYK